MRCSSMLLGSSRPSRQYSCRLGLGEARLCSRWLHICHTPCRSTQARSTACQCKSRLNICGQDGGEKMFVDS